MVTKKVLFAESWPREAVVWSASTFCCPYDRPPGTLNVAVNVPSEATGAVVSGIRAIEIETAEQPDAVLQNPEPTTLTDVPSGPCDGVSVIEGNVAACVVMDRSRKARPTASVAAAAARARRQLLICSKRTRLAQGNRPPGKTRPNGPP